MWAMSDRTPQGEALRDSSAYGQSESIEGDFSARQLSGRNPDLPAFPRDASGTAGGMAVPACSRKIPMICSPVNRLRFMHPSPRLTDSNNFRESFKGSGHNRSGLWIGVFRTILGPNSVRIGAFMRLSTQVRPISYLKANAAEVLSDLAETRQPLVITQNGEAKAVLQDVVSFEQGQETLALLKLLALGQQDIEAGRTRAARDVAARLRVGVRRG
jgi:prevent-host-death family protein